MKKLFFYMVAAAIALTSCSSEDVVEVNNNGNAIDFRVAMGPGANSRGLETTKDNLKEFFVTAVYDESHGNYFANELFKVDDVKFNSENRFMWPTEKLNFYAYSYGVKVTDDDWDSFASLYTTKEEMNQAREELFGSVTIEYGTQKFTGFEPKTEISEQIDFVTATASGTGSDQEKTNGVALTFEHALSQILIQAQETDPEYIYNIRGVKIVNVISKDEYNMGNGLWLNTDETATDKPTYSTSNGNIGSYTIEYTEPINLTATPQNIMLAENGSAMLIPQQLNGWEPENVATSTGAYIAVLLQVKMKGTGTQAYPLTITNEQYAWAAIPINTKWEKGYKYVYTLDFSNGAGYDEITGVQIFDGMISYTCDVTPWDESKSEKPVGM